MSKLGAWWFRMKFGVPPHRHQYVKIGSNTWACSVTCKDPNSHYVHHCGAWYGEQAWSA